MASCRGLAAGEALLVVIVVAIVGDDVDVTVVVVDTVVVDVDGGGDQCQWSGGGEWSRWRVLLQSLGNFFWKPSLCLVGTGAVRGTIPPTCPATSATWVTSSESQVYICLGRMR